MPYVYVIDYDDALKMIDSFGSVIQSINIVFHRIDGSRGREILNKINDKCHRLSSLGICSYRESICDELKRQFPTVRKLIFVGGETESSTIDANKCKLNYTLPELNFLALRYMLIPNWALFDGHFAKLQHLELSIPKYLNNDYITHAIDFVKANAQIFNLTLENTKLSLLKAMNDYLPQLKYLQLRRLSKNYLNYNGQPVRFNTVEHLMIKSETESRVPSNCIFTQLKSLHLNVHHRISYKWFAFLTDQVNSNVTNLTIIAMMFSPLKLTILPKSLNGLESVYVSSEMNICVNEIGIFVRYSELLQDLTIQMPIDVDETEDYHINYEKKLKNLMGDSWHVEYERHQNLNVCIKLKRKGYAIVTFGIADLEYFIAGMRAPHTHERTYF